MKRKRGERIERGEEQEQGERRDGRKEEAILGRKRSFACPCVFVRRGGNRRGGRGKRERERERERER